MSAREIYTTKPTPEEIDDVLGQRLTAAIGTLNEDGSIHLAYVIFLYEDDKLYFETASVTRKAINAAARGGASFLVEGTASTGTSLMVAGEGTARVLDGEAAHEMNRKLREKYIVADAVDAIDLSWSKLDDVSVEITPTEWRSWTGRAFYEHTQKTLGERPLNKVWL